MYICIYVYIYTNSIYNFVTKYHFTLCCPLSQVPIMGAGLSLASPLAFSLFFLGGDHLLQWLLIPLAATLETFPKAESQRALGKRQVGGARKGRRRQPRLGPVAAAEGPWGEWAARAIRPLPQPTWGLGSPAEGPWGERMGI